MRGVNRRDACRLRQMLSLAIDYHDALIDAHTVTRYGGRQPETHIPREHRALVARCLRDIAAWKRLVDKLLAGKGG